MSDKYKLIDSGVTVNYGACSINVKLYRVKALRSFGDVKKGDLGGFVTSTDNLGQLGHSWIYDNAMVIDQATLMGDAKIYDNVHLTGRARMFGKSKAQGYSIVKDQAKVFGCATLSDYAHVSGDVTISSDAKIRDYATISGNAYVSGNATVGGQTSLNGMVQVFTDVIESNMDYVCVGPIGSRDAYLTCINGKIFSTGCFTGTIEEFIVQLMNYEKNFTDCTSQAIISNHKKMYLDAIKYIDSIFASRKKIKDAQDVL